MPANVVKTVADENKWEKAKAIVKKQYGDVGPDKKWPLVMKIFKNLKGGQEKTAGKAGILRKMWRNLSGSKVKSVGKAIAGKNKALTGARRELVGIRSHAQNIAKGKVKASIVPSLYKAQEAKAIQKIKGINRSRMGLAKNLASAKAGRSAARITTLGVGGLGAYALWPKGKKQE